MRAGLLAAVVAASGCAGSGGPPAGSGSWLHPSFGPGHLESGIVVVLPVGTVSLPPGAGSVDSLTGALATRGGEALANALQAGGAAGMAVRPPATTLSREDLADLYAPLEPAVLEADRGGEIPQVAATTWRETAARADARFFLVPRRLAITQLEPLRVRAEYDAWLVDGDAALVLWHAPVSAVNPHAPSGVVVDVYGAVLADALDAAAARVAARLALVERTGVDETANPR